jgi:hypothetical protein
MTDGKIAFGKPKHVTATGDRAYAVIPSTYAFKAAGKPSKEIGQMTFALHKEATGWRITGWAWADQ